MAIKEEQHLPTLDKIVSSWPIGQVVNASEAYWYTLEMLGVEDVAAYIGGRVLKLLDEFKATKKIRLIVGPHEQDLGHLCQGYFKVKRKPMNIVVTSGPGGTDIATVIQDSHADSDAIMATIGQVPLESIEDGEESFQGALMVEPFKYWAKATFRITSANEVQSVIKTAYHTATTNRPGPVVIEFPSTIQWEKVVLKPLEEVPLIPIQLEVPPVYKRVQVKSFNLGEVVNTLSKSKMPLLYYGGGIHNANAAKEGLQLARHIDSPIITTLMTLGVIPNDRLNLGLPGMHGSPESNLALYNSDVLVVVGARLDDRIVGDPEKFAPYAEIFWIEPNYPGIGRKIALRVKKLEVDAKEALEYLLANAKPMKHDSWLNQIYAWREKYPMPTHAPREVIEQIREFVEKYEDKEPYVTTGVGAHQIFLAEFWKFNPELGKRMLLTSGGLGTMGTGTPFGVGALIAEPNRPVYVFNGDGSLIMDQRSLLMAYQQYKYGLTKYKHGLKEIVFRDNSLGMVDHWQELVYGGNKVVSELDLPPLYFQKMAEQNEFSYFVVDYMNGNREKNRAVIEEFVKYKGNALLEVRMLPEPVFPMVPSMKSVPEMKLPYGMKLDTADLLVGKR